MTPPTTPHRVLISKRWGWAPYEPRDPNDSSALHAAGRLPNQHFPAHLCGETLSFFLVFGAGHPFIAWGAEAFWDTSGLVPTPGAGQTAPEGRKRLPGRTGRHPPAKYSGGSGSYFFCLITVSWRL